MRCLISSIFALACTLSIAQNDIETEIQANNVFELSIVDVFPENYPMVSVIFQAKNSKGKPLWLLDPSEMSITENAEECEIVKLINITENRPLNIGLVFDHSSSMFYNTSVSPDSLDLMSMLYFNGLPLPSDYSMAIDFAKDGVLGFMDDAEESDSMLFVGFSTEVDEIYQLSNSLEEIRPFLESVRPDGSTAFYDAMYLSLDSLEAHSSSSAIVGLTDGGDNSSIHTYQEVIAKAKKNGTPIYIIGLGDVNKSLLKRICNATNGFFYQTNDPNKLKEIYANIKGQLKSVYQVDYRSLSEDYKNMNRVLKFSFLNDTLTFSNPTARFSLPEEAKSYLEKKKAERAEKIEADKQKALNDTLLWGGLAGGILVLGIGSFWVIRRRKTKLKIEMIHPNPFSDSVTVTYEVSDGILDAQLQVYSLRGNLVESHPVNSASSELTLDTVRYGRGVYIFKLSSSGKSSEGIKGVKR